MRILFVGGTRFVGRAMAEAAIAAGHDVTVLHRGGSPSSDLPAAEHLLADRDKDLSVLDQREFDATIDVCAYVPRQVESLAAALGGRGGHHVFISTVSVYSDAVQSGFAEDGPLVDTPDPSVEEVTGETYGGLKVLCERAADAAYGSEHVTIVRPSYVLGPYDRTLRFPWWVRRLSRGGEVLCPGPGRSPMQYIDARDQGTWTVGLAEGRVAGVFNGIGSSIPFGFGELLAATAEVVAPAGTVLTEVDGPWLVERGVDGAALPLWSEGETEWPLAGSNAKAIATGLTPRPLAETVRDTQAWLDVALPELPAQVGLAPDRERELLVEWHANRP